MRFQNQLSKLLLFGCIYFATVSFCDAQESLFGTGGAVMQLLRYKEVQNELKINDDQTTQMALILKEMDQEMRQAWLAWSSGCAHPVRLGNSRTSVSPLSETSAIQMNLVFTTEPTTKKEPCIHSLVPGLPC